jgi:hypothetical protein
MDKFFSKTLTSSTAGERDLIKERERDTSHYV